MAPTATMLLIMLNNAKVTTTNPAVLKNIPALELFRMPSELKLTNARTGNVPNANDNMVKPPLRKPPVVSAYNCIDWVNPQGKKNVTTPTKNGVKV